MSLKFALLINRSDACCPGVSEVCFFENLRILAAKFLTFLKGLAKLVICFVDIGIIQPETRGDDYG